jgi:hypothetical protein
MMLDTIDTAYMSALSLDDLPAVKRRVAFLLSTPAQAPPDTIASVLVGKHPYFIRAIERFHEDPEYFEFLVDCGCTAYANAAAEYSAIDAPAVENMPTWPIAPPPGYPAGVAPASVVEDDLRAEYAARMEAFKRLQSQRNAKQRAELGLKRATESLQTIAERIRATGDEEVEERFFEILRHRAGETAVQDLLPDEAEAS